MSQGGSVSRKWDKNSNMSLSKKIASYTILILLLVHILFITGFVIFHLYYANRILPGVHVANIDLSGKTVEEAYFLLEEKTKTPVSFAVSTEKHEKVFDSTSINFTYDINATIRDAFKVGREGDFLTATKEKLLTVINSKNLNYLYSYDKNDIRLFIALLKLEGTSNYVEPAFSYEKNKIQIIEGKEGIDFDSIELEDEIVSKLVKFDNTPLLVNTFQKIPDVNNDEMLMALSLVEEVVKDGINLIYKSDSWYLPKEDIVTFARLSRSEEGIKVSEDINLVFDKLLIIQKLKQLAPQIERAPSAQILDVNDGKVIDFKPSLDGRELLVNDSAEIIMQALLSKQKESNLAIKATSLEGSANDYGIIEVIGVGTSKFAGSIPSRVYNVGLASSRVSGILVPPGEVFSFNKAVGEVSSKTGYKPAYVISGGRTILGDGGGLCQVSTTVFRAALDAGFPIVARSPHSYRVGYYEQDSGPGIDATVYVPSVDLKFKNDTEKYILIISEFDAKAMTLKYTIYGTSDGRKVEMSKPKILSKRAPGPTIYQEDPGLAKGAKVRLETAVWGATVEFTRKVTKEGVTLYDDVFKSNYRAWPAVYKIGTRE